MELRGEVIDGDGYEHKVPTANVLMQKPIPEGVYRGNAWLGSDLLGRSLVWVVPYRAAIAEVYVSKWRKSLRGSFLSVTDLKQVNRKEMMKYYDEALAT